MTQLAALGLDNEDLENDWAWDVDISADVAARVERLKTGQFTRLELYEELLELMAVLEVYWRGVTPERQQTSARKVRDLLRKFEALKERMQTWARKELARRLPRTRARLMAEDVPNHLDDAMNELRKDFRARHPKLGIFRWPSCAINRHLQATSVTRSIQISCARSFRER
jgi:hypothetical protein